MCIRTPPEQRSSRKYMQAVRCHGDGHEDYAYFRFWRAAHQWPQRAEAIGDFYVAAAQTTLDSGVAKRRQRYAKRFYRRAAQRVPTIANRERLAEQYRVLATMATIAEKVQAYEHKALLAQRGSFG